MFTASTKAGVSRSHWYHERAQRTTTNPECNRLQTPLLHLISSHLISSHLISSHLISSHLISSHLISSHLISSHLISSHLISSHLISSWSSFRTPRVEHTAHPAPSVHHDCLQFTCVSQPCILQQVVNLHHFLPSDLDNKPTWVPPAKRLEMSPRTIIQN